MKLAKSFIVFTFLSAFALQVSAQKTKTSRGLDNLDLMSKNRQSINSGSSIVTPNELAGFEFFKTGKLNNIKIGASTKADIQKIFGSDCEKPCDYDSNWTITFDYFSENQVLVEEKYNQKLYKSVHTNYIPRKEFIGKIESVMLRPKKTFSFDNITFTDSFKKYSFIESAYLNSDPKDGVLIDGYLDSYGLQYFIFNKFTSENIKDFNLRKLFANLRKGDLISIKYTIPEDMESIFFVEDN